MVYDLPITLNGTSSIYANSYIDSKLGDNLSVNMTLSKLTVNGNVKIASSKNTTLDISSAKIQSGEIAQLTKDNSGIANDSNDYNGTIKLPNTSKNDTNNKNDGTNNANGNVNGGTGTTASGKKIGAPNAGVNLIISNPLTIVIVGVITAVSIKLLIIKRSLVVSKK